VAQKENRYCQQAYVKDKGRNGKNRLLSHAVTGKGNEPPEDGTKRPSQAEVVENHLILLSGKTEKRNDPYDHSYNENSKRYPGERTSDEPVHGNLQVFQFKAI